MPACDCMSNECPTRGQECPRTVRESDKFAREWCFLPKMMEESGWHGICC